MQEQVACFIIFNGSRERVYIMDDDKELEEEKDPEDTDVDDTDDDDDDDSAGVDEYE